MKGLVHLDTLYLVVKYPHVDVFEAWYRHARGQEYRRLKEGIQHGDFVVRNGASCYKVSVWQHDARVFLTDQVEDRLKEGSGSGIWIQLGPRFLTESMDRLQSAVRELLAAVGVSKEYPTKINRLDIAVDLFGVDMQDQSLALWQEGWVGRSKVSDFHFNSRTSALETIYIGSRKAAIFLRVYDKVAQAVAAGDLPYWVDLWKGFSGPVTRVEWQVKPSEGNFQKDLQDFELFNGLSMRELLNYLLDWGRLCEPDPIHPHRWRWKDAQLWQTLRDVAAEFSDGVDWPTSRFGKQYHEVSDAYVKFLAGAVSGGMARFGLEQEPNMVRLIEGLEKHGHTLDAVQKDAKRKAAIISRL
jgi:hypothetical protein